jgi:hypothetical protein
MKHAFAGALLIVGLIAAAPASAQLLPAEKCYDCPKPREHYDTQETIRTTRDVDHSRVIETQSEEPVSRQVKETNHLIIRENETRNVGTVQHNHTIIERVPRYVVRVPVVTTVSYVTYNYRVVETPATMTVPVQYQPPRRCAYGKRHGYDDTCRRVLRVRG